MKAYWMATVLIGTPDEITPRADGKELLELKWFPLEEAYDVIKKTNHAAKGILLVDCLKACEADLFGSTAGLQM